MVQILKRKLSAKLKFLFYNSRRYLARHISDSRYRFEYEFFEAIRAGTYSDLNFTEAKLRSKAHQLDKTLTFKEFRRNDRLAKSIADLTQEVTAYPDHDLPLVHWCDDILSEFEHLANGNHPTVEMFVPHFDIRAQTTLRKVIESRRSIRRFKQDAIQKDTLHRILDAGLWAPTGCNRQTIEYLILEERADIEYCQRIAGENNSFPTEAPINVVVLVDPRNYSLPSQRHMAFLEGGAAIQNMLLTARSFGIGSCWLFWSDTAGRHSEFVKKFGLQPWLLAVGMVCFGYPEKVPKFCPVRKALARCLHFPRETTL